LGIEGRLLDELTLSARQGTENQAHLVFGNHEMQPNKNQKSLMEKAKRKKKRN